MGVCKAINIKKIKCGYLCLYGGAWDKSERYQQRQHGLITGH